MKKSNNDKFFIGPTFYPQTMSEKDNKDEYSERRSLSRMNFLSSGCLETSELTGRSRFHSPTLRSTSRSSASLFLPTTSSQSTTQNNTTQNNTTQNKFHPVHIMLYYINQSQLTDSRLNENKSLSGLGMNMAGEMSLRALISLSRRFVANIEREVLRSFF